jgi:type I restriction enzyme R subunit
MVIDQLTARGTMDASSLYEPPFSGLHAGGPEALFAGKENVIEGIFELLEYFQPMLAVSLVKESNG